MSGTNGKGTETGAPKGNASVTVDPAAPRRVRDVLANAFAGWGVHADSQMAAAVAYYSALTLAPTLLLALMIAGFFIDPATLYDTLGGTMSTVLGEDSVALITDAMRALFDLKSSGSLAIVGLMTLLFGATGLLLQVRSALRRIWGVTASGHLMRNLARERGIATIALGVLVAALLLLVGAWWAIGLLAPEEAGGLLKQLATAGLSFLLGLAAYRFFPGARVSWRAAAGGAAVATVGWAINAKGIGIYFDIVPTATLYGAAGSLIVILVWVYFGATILLFGGELARAIDGSPV